MAQDSSLPDFWDVRYQGGVTPWEGGVVPLEEMAFFARLPTASRILVPGCGSAHDVHRLLDLGLSVEAIDFSHEAISQARIQLGERAGCLAQADFFALEAHQQYLAVFERAFLCALPLRCRADYAKKMADLIVPGGYLAGFFFLADKPKGPPFGISLAELTALLGNDFILENSVLMDETLPVFAGSEHWMVWRRL